MALENCERQTAPTIVKDANTLIEEAFAEMTRLRAWLGIISRCNAESSNEGRYARRIKYMARRALNGDPV